ncbi:hypothetical protein H9M94_00145 [Mycoplasma sp. Pen4]|uniref:hypothetical protein n=1 Tax=Mycoplasma sp. Pen4 TaxID=640330 RepID=UPI0016542C4E|nr:hypothetical protein [Mycoplasma sp. Pen4]QNM93677.1 hypothetical protein H9M94_00145 [Mycoplasma sp. Pen4]
MKIKRWQLYSMIGFGVCASISIAAPIEFFKSDGIYSKTIITKQDLEKVNKISDLVWENPASENFDDVTNLINQADINIFVAGDTKETSDTMTKLSMFTKSTSVIMYMNVDNDVLSTINKDNLDAFYNKEITAHDDDLNVKIRQANLTTDNGQYSFFDSLVKTIKDNKDKKVQIWLPIENVHLFPKRIGDISQYNNVYVNLLSCKPNIAKELTTKYRTDIDKTLNPSKYLVSDTYSFWNFINTPALGTLYSSINVFLNTNDEILLELKELGLNNIYKWNKGNQDAIINLDNKLFNTNDSTGISLAQDWATINQINWFEQIFDKSIETGPNLVIENSNDKIGLDVMKYLFATSSTSIQKFTYITPYSDITYYKELKDQLAKALDSNVRFDYSDYENDSKLKTYYFSQFLLNKYNITSPFFKFKEITESSEKLVTSLLQWFIVDPLLLDNPGFIKLGASKKQILGFMLTEEENKIVTATNDPELFNQIYKNSITKYIENNFVLVHKDQKYSLVKKDVSNKNNILFKFGEITVNNDYNSKSSINLSFTYGNEEFSDINLIVNTKK